MTEQKSYTIGLMNFCSGMKLLTIQTLNNRKFDVLNIFPSFKKLYFLLSEQDGFILDLCATFSLYITIFTICFHVDKRQQYTINVTEIQITI